MSSSGQYALTAEGFIIQNYNHTKPFSNFFPGIAGVWGIPMWVFYVNRGQCISSFGIQSKDKAILEFQPANKAYRLTSLQGFRTFLKIKSGAKTLFWEPFQNNSSAGIKTQQKMFVTSHDLVIEDAHPQLGLKIRVKYFTLPEEPLAALVREVELINTSRKKLSVEMIDGLPIMNCYGLNDWAAKNMSRTVEAWINVGNIKKKAPYYHLKVDIADTSQVQHIQEGNFYFSFIEEGKKTRLLDPLVQTELVFGNSADFRVPEAFLNAKAAFQIPSRQETSNRTPSAMSYHRSPLKAKGQIKMTSCIGFAYTLEQLDKFMTKALQNDFIAVKEWKNKTIVEGVKDFAFTKSSMPAFDAYCGQTFLDNVLRGGLPISLETQEGTEVFNVYSRKHGDPERDYNYFVLAPTYFSQGNGNYRDVNQNRRNDPWFNIHAGQTNLLNFLNLVQADGFNPLVVKGTTFVVDDAGKLGKILEEGVPQEHQAALKSILQKAFQPGELINFLIQKKINLKVSHQAFLGKVLSIGHKQEQCDHGEGFWTDHWTYNLDLLESFMALYPDAVRSLFWEERKFTFYHNSHYVLPRDQRYILTDRGVRQYHSVMHDPKITKADERGNRLRAHNGEGDVYKTFLPVKLLCLAANKAASLDPSGIGIEMEADKPNWYDALNGLPGLIGSSVSETFELKRLCVFIKTILRRLDLPDEAKIPVFAELYSFLSRLTHLSSMETDPFAYWQKANDVKEHYRYRVRQGIEGQENEMTVREIRHFLDAVIRKTEQGIGRAKKNGLFATYFYHEVTEHAKIEKVDAKPIIRPLKFRRHDLPLFLEGFVHALRVTDNRNEAKNLYQKVKTSPLFDAKLKMYKVNDDLSGETEEIGRTRIFPPGWLENGSIWLHMEYKFLLELLRCGLYDEFYENFDRALVPFLKPEQYGRSILENSSFIVSSAHEDKSLHGQGFVARLSGSTAEFIHMWLLMNVGPQPFRQNGKGELTMDLQPALRGAFFTKNEETCEYYNAAGQKRKEKLPKNTYAFKLFGTTLVVYHNPRRKDTFGPDRPSVKKITVTYSGSQPITLSSTTVSPQHVQALRQQKIERLDIYFT